MPDTNTDKLVEAFHLVYDVINEDYDNKPGPIPDDRIIEWVTP